MHNCFNFVLFLILSEIFSFCELDLWHLVTTFFSEHKGIYHSKEKNIICSARFLFNLFPFLGAVEYGIKDWWWNSWSSFTCYFQCIQRTKENLRYAVTVAVLAMHFLWVMKPYATPLHIYIDSTILSLPLVVPLLLRILRRWNQHIYALKLQKCK